MNTSGTPPAIEERRLISGDLPATVADVEARLSSLAIDFKTVNHPPMFTVEDSRKFRQDVPGGYSKNLFLRNKKGRMWLVTLEEGRQVDLAELGERIGAGRVSFASPQRLMHYLGVYPGAVTPLAVINDRSHKVSAWIDAGLLQQAPLHFHPCDNSHTTTVTTQGLLKFMRDCEHEPAMLEFDPSL